MQATHFKSSPVRAGEVPTKLTAPFPATDPMRLLLIEDDLQAAEYLIKSLREHGYDGWLLYNFRDLNPIAQAVVGLSHGGSRRWFCCGRQCSKRSTP